jgi:cell shape-determining protein MreC
VLLINDVDSGVGVLLKNRSRGVLEGAEGEMPPRIHRHGRGSGCRGSVYTSGEDRVFLKGWPVGEVIRGPVSDYREIWCGLFAALAA